MDMVLIPLTVAMKGFVKAVGSTVFSATIFQFAMDAITKNVFTLTTASKDKSPPVFSTPCTVHQAIGRDLTNPGVMLTFAAKDPDTKVNTTFWFVGTTLGGSDVVPRTELDPSTATTFQPLKVAEALAIYFTVEACNFDQFCSTSSCQLPSWNVKPPSIEVHQVRNFVRKAAP